MVYQTAFWTKYWGKQRQNKGKPYWKIKKKIEYLEIQVGLDALAVVVPKSNEWLTCLTFEELGLIWGADNAVSNWNQVRSDFPDEEINLFGPGTDSGTFDYFNATTH